MTVTLDKFGRILIPKPLRDQLGLAPGAELALDVHHGGDGGPSIELRAIPDANDPEGGLIRVNGRLLHNGRPAGDMDVARILREQYEARARRHAGLDRTENGPAAGGSDGP